MDKLFQVSASLQRESAGLDNLNTLMLAMFLVNTRVCANVCVFGLDVFILDTCEMHELKMGD